MSAYHPSGGSKGVIIAFHGGGFTGGSHTWDKVQNELLATAGYTVIQPEFPKTHSEFCKWAKENSFTDHAYRQKLYVLGRSSGGYLAKLYASLNPLVEKCIYLAPVFDPITRAAINTKFMGRTEEFFDEEPIDTTELSDNELLLMAEADENVPPDCFTAEQLKKAVYLTKTHRGVCTMSSVKFRTLVDKFLSESD